MNEFTFAGELLNRRALVSVGSGEHCSHFFAGHCAFDRVLVQAVGDHRGDTVLQCVDTGRNLGGIIPRFSVVPYLGLHSAGTEFGVGSEDDV